MGYAYGNNVSVRSGNSNNVSSFTLSFPSATASGNLNVVGLYIPTGIGITSVTDNHSGTYTVLGPSTDAGLGLQLFIAYFVCTFSGTGYVVTVNLNASTGVGVNYGYWRADYTGNTGTPFDAYTFNNGTASAMTLSPGNANSGDMALGFSVNGTTFAAAGSGFTLGASSAQVGSVYVAAEVNFNVAASATVNFSTPASSTWTMICATFKSLGGGASMPLSLQQNLGYNTFYVQDH